MDRKRGFVFLLYLMLLILMSKDTFAISTTLYKASRNISVANFNTYTQKTTYTDGRHLQFNIFLYKKFLRILLKDILNVLISAPTGMTILEYAILLIMIRIQRSAS